jgi:hypothetical protein
MWYWVYDVHMEVADKAFIKAGGEVVGELFV